MAILRTSFRNIPSTGVIPDEMLPAREWAVSYAFSYEVDIADPTPTTLINSTLVLHVTNGAGAVKYVVTIKERYFYLLMRPAPNLVFYTWNWVPTAEKIEGRKGMAPDAPLMKTLGQGTFGVEPAQDSGNSDRTALIESRYYSVIFQEPLERGDKLKITRHTVDTSAVVAQARLQLATELGASVSCALRDPRVGTVWHVAPHGEEGSRIANTRRSATFERKATSFVTGRRTIFARVLRHGATMHFLVVYPFEASTNMSVLTSLDGGASWDSNDMLLDNFHVLAARLSGDGGTMWLYGLAPANEKGASPTPVPSRAVLKRSGGGWKANDKAVIKYLDMPQQGEDKPLPPPLPAAGVVTLEASGSTLHLVAGGDGNTEGTGASSTKPDPVRIWESTDELASLREMKITDGEAADDAADDGG